MHGKLRPRRFPYTRAFAFVVLFGNRTFRHFVFTHKVNRCAMRTTKTEIPEVLWPLSLPGKRKIGRNSEKALLKRLTFLSSPLDPAKNCWKRIFRKYWNCFVNKGGYQYSKGLSNWFACYEELSKKTPDIVIVSFEKYLLQLCKVNLTLRRKCQQIPFFPISLVWAGSMLSR